MNNMNLTSVETWHEDTVSSSVWWPYYTPSYPDLKPLQPKKTYNNFSYLQMLKKLTPYGRIWEFPIGEAGDYDGS
jgi:hypothetical protein